MGEEQYGWDLLLPELVQLFVEPWDEPLVGVNRRQSTATPLAMRALRRTQAVDMLFRSGYYWESHALIRSAYEDWLELARAAAFSGRIDRPHDSNSLGDPLLRAPAHLPAARLPSAAIGQGSAKS